MQDQIMAISLRKLFRLGSRKGADQALGASVRPVRVDEEGRIFELTGDPIVVTGLEPAKVLQGLDDDDAGRTRSLEEIMSERPK